MPSSPPNTSRYSSRRWRAFETPLFGVVGVFRVWGVCVRVCVLVAVICVGRTRSSVTSPTSRLQDDPYEDKYGDDDDEEDEEEEN